MWLVLNNDRCHEMTLPCMRNAKRIMHYKIILPYPVPILPYEY